MSNPAPRGEDLPIHSWPYRWFHPLNKQLMMQPNLAIFNEAPMLLFCFNHIYPTDRGASGLPEINSQAICQVCRIPAHLLKPGPEAAQVRGAPASPEEYRIFAAQGMAMGVVAMPPTKHDADEGHAATVAYLSNTLNVTSYLI